LSMSLSVSVSALMFMTMSSKLSVEISMAKSLHEPELKHELGYGQRDGRGHGLCPCLRPFFKVLSSTESMDQINESYFKSATCPSKRFAVLPFLFCGVTWQEVSWDRMGGGGCFFFSHLEKDLFVYFSGGWGRGCLIFPRAFPLLPPSPVF
jgi:hypothetical protein